MKNIGIKDFVNTANMVIGFLNLAAMVAGFVAARMDAQLVVIYVCSALAAVLFFVLVYRIVYALLKNFVEKRIQAAVKTLENRTEMLILENMLSRQWIIMLNNQQPVSSKLMFDMMALQVGERFQLPPQKAREYVKRYLPQLAIDAEREK